jgi:hypothetical protein
MFEGFWQCFAFFGNEECKNLSTRPLSGKGDPLECPGSGT